MPTIDYKTEEVHHCCQEARLTVIESKLENKKEHLHEVDEDYYHLRDKLDMINLNVAEVTTIMKTMQDDRDKTEKRFDDTNEKIYDLKNEITELKSNWENLKLIIGLGVPIITTILTIVANWIL